MIFLRLNLLMIATYFMTGCSIAKITPVAINDKLNHRIKNIAIHNVVGDLDINIGNDLRAHGYKIIYIGPKPTPVPANETKDMSIAKPNNFSHLLEQDVDAILIVKSYHGTLDTHIKAAEVRLYSTHQKVLVAGASWKNSQLGFQGSQADSILREGSLTAARDINIILLKQLYENTLPESLHLYPSATSLMIKTAGEAAK